MGKLLPILLALLGLGGGIGAGLMLKPPESHDAGEGEAAGGAGHETDPGAESGADPGAHGAEGEASPPDMAAGEVAQAGEEEEFVRLNNQFVIPVVQEGRVVALVVMSISLQVHAGTSEAVFAREPKLRDEFLQVLFAHANAGGFDGTFTSAGNLRALRQALLEAASSVLGERVTDVLILDIMRQDS